MNNCNECENYRLIGKLCSIECPSNSCANYQPKPIIKCDKCVDGFVLAGLQGQNGKYFYFKCPYCDKGWLEKK